MAKEIMSVNDLCEYLGIGKSTVYIKIVKTREIPIPYLRIGNTIRFRKIDIDKYFEKGRED